MELSVADVDGDHARRTGLQQAVREPAGGRPDVRAVTAGDVDVERGKRIRELLSPARDEARRLLHGQLDVVGDLLARLRVSENAPGEDERLGLRARLREPALDEDDVEALLRHEAQ